MNSYKSLEDPHNYLFPETQKLIAQAWKMHMLRRMKGLYKTKYPGWIWKRHQNAISDFVSKDVISLGTSWMVKSSKVPEEGVMVNFVNGSDIACDCVDYPHDYVCKECSICIHMYKCSCPEVEKHPTLICKHIHAVCLFGEDVVRKQDIKKHIHTPHQTPGHRWPYPMIYRYDWGINCKKRKLFSHLVPVSSEEVKINDDLAKEKILLPPNWDTDFYKDEIAQEHIINEIKDTLARGYFKKPRLESDFQEDVADSLYKRVQQETRGTLEDVGVSIVDSKKAECELNSQEDPADMLYKKILQERKAASNFTCPQNDLELPKQYMTVDGLIEQSQSIECTECEFKCINSMDLSTHLRTHNIFKCDHCDGYRGNSLKNLQAHMRMWCPKKKYRDCSHCGLKNIGIDRIWDHMKTHIGITSSPSTQENDLQNRNSQSVKEVSSLTEPDQIICVNNILYKLSPIGKATQSTSMSIHTMQNNPNIVLEASSASKDQDSLKEHGQTLQCSECEFVCQNSLAFTRHVKTHVKGQGIFKCAKCSFGTDSSYALTRHMRTHKDGISKLAEIRNPNFKTPEPNYVQANELLDDLSKS